MIRVMEFRSVNSAIIKSLSHDGRGVAVINGKTTFISGALPGEEISFQYTKKHSKYDEGQATEIHVASADRAVPKCRHFSICGGCSLQHLDPQAQISFKQNVLLEQLAHIGGIKPKNILPPLLGKNWQYRHKARLSVKFVVKKNKLLVGFHEKKSNFIADIDSCEILHPAIGKKITDLADLIKNFSIYTQIPQIEVAISDEKVALIFRHLQPFAAADLQLLQQFGATHNIHIYLQSGGTETIKLFYPEGSDLLLQYRLQLINQGKEINLQFAPNDFTQVNPDINRQMIQRAIELLEPKKTDHILDLFCGIGNFTLPLAMLCDHVTGVEGEAKLVQRAEANALANNLAATFYTANLANNLFVQQSWATKKYDKILLDPPRSGASELVANIALFAAKKILYISCNTATLARDAALLAQQGYQLCKVGVMDMFPHTSHVEAMALFEKKHGKTNNRTC